MASAGNRLRVFLASPGDVVEERSRMDSVVSFLNSTLGDTEGIHIELARWETHAWPGFGADAQDVINGQIDPGDIFVGLLWRRIGTPTHRAISGTVEEFERAYALWLATGRPSMMLYFCTTPFYPTAEDLEQFPAVLAFKEHVAKKGAFYREYDGPDEFEELVRKHLYMAVRSEIRSPLPGADPDSASRVMGALESSRNVGQGYRTVGGLAQATRLPEAEVTRVLDRNEDLIIRSTIPDRKGNALFRLREESPDPAHEESLEKKMRDLSDSWASRRDQFG